MIGTTARLQTAKSRLAAALWQSDASVVIPGTGRRATHWPARVGQVTVLMMVPSPAIHHGIVIIQGNFKLHLVYGPSRIQDTSLFTGRSGDSEEPARQPRLRLANCHGNCGHCCFCPRPGRPGRPGTTGHDRPHCRVRDHQVTVHRVPVQSVQLAALPSGPLAGRSCGTGRSEVQ